MVPYWQDRSGRRLKPQGQERRIDVWRQRNPTEEAVVLGRGGAGAHPEALPADETTDEATAVGRVP